MTHLLGRLFQFLGLILLPIGLGYGLFGDNIALEVRLLAIGAALFVVGWLLTKAARVNM